MKEPDCVFCKICSEEEPRNILYKDDNFIAFPNIKPAAKHHYLVVTRNHIKHVRHLTKEHIPLVEKFMDIGRQILIENGGDLSDARIGFHWPPFVSVKHIHLHVISPASSLGFKARLFFHPNSWWFVTVSTFQLNKLLLFILILNN
ncbi:hypothetical protein C0J52_00325 [Blattella germanica]|nr:hypothetical protein C0J52_00325 [Blattella germanica]